MIGDKMMVSRLHFDVTFFNLIFLPFKYIVLSSLYHLFNCLTDQRCLNFIQFFIRGEIYKMIHVISLNISIPTTYNLFVFCLIDITFFLYFLHLLLDLLVVSSLSHIFRLHNFKFKLKLRKFILRTLRTFIRILKQVLVIK